ncbi:hypothetical protein CKAN_02759300 [Cinnamomum micranthum f. kanehirae]|uniref:Uncharacterized protein n=1 Tax=Cinnamomum micranthum f. kanehirae TaxID=337451 RepID=A0A3S4Q2Q8_9MAGN|nr:hypothetical protein CKAN_02759300 [Cinnamomum micranthum f. kanehirae]
MAGLTSLHGKVLPNAYLRSRTKWKECKLMVCCFGKSFRESLGLEFVHIFTPKLRIMVNEDYWYSKLYSWWNCVISKFHFLVSAPDRHNSSVEDTAMDFRDDNEEANEDIGVRPRIDVERVVELLRLRLHIRGTMGCSIGFKESSTKMKEKQF